MLLNPDFGTLDGLEQSGFTDYLYFSAVVFTTLGFGDIVPLGYIRLYVSIEALTGLSLIAWSMSSAFEEFQRYES
ncbi:potassium channel family protein [Vibrio sp. Isolate22]|nr:potassium channel family protein [Vibrio sp. Isolate22]